MTSVICVSSLCNRMRMPFLAFTFSVRMPIIDTTRTALCLTSDKLNLPSRSVIALFCVPSTNTFTPISGSLSSAEITVPDTVVCAKAIPTERNSSATTKLNFLYINIF